MKIALFVDHFPSLSETFVVSHIAGLMERGHDVRIVSQVPGDTKVVHAAVTRHGMLDRTVYLADATGTSRRDHAVRAARLTLRRGWRSPGTVLRALDVTRQGRSAMSLRLLADGLACLGQGPFDIIHCHFGPVGVRAMRLRQIGVLKGRLVVTFHGYDMTSYVRRRGTAAYSRLFADGDLFLPISERWRERLIELGCPPQRTVVHRMGVDCSRFAFRASRPVDGRVQVLTIARLVEKKGVEYAIRAVAELLHAGCPIDYTIVGDGPRYPALRQLVDELGVADHVHLPGGQSQEQTRERLQAAHLFMAPSVTAANGDQEGVPVAIMEAMAVGLPVLSTWHSGIPELVADGETGVLVPERDVAALAEALKCLVDQPERWPDMARAGRARVEAEYDQTRLNDRLDELYRSLLARR